MVQNRRDARETLAFALGAYKLQLNIIIDLSRYTSHKSRYDFLHYIRISAASSTGASRTLLSLSVDVW